MPWVASPAAKVVACASAIPTSKKRSGHFFWNRLAPVPEGLAAVIATSHGRGALRHRDQPVPEEVARPLLRRGDRGGACDYLRRRARDPGHPARGGDLLHGPDALGREPGGEGSRMRLRAS